MDRWNQVVLAAVASLTKLTGVATKEMQLSDESSLAEQEAAIAAWKLWWKSQK